MNSINDLEMSREVALDALKKLQSEDQGNLYRYLLEAAAVIAGVVCSEEQRFSILELFSISGKGPFDAYRIIFANPLESEDSPRHGASEIGMLYEPSEKLALTEAMKLSEVVIVNEIGKNPLADYIGIHIENKKLKHMAVLPCLGYLLIFDRVACHSAFSQEEKRFLIQAARSVKFGFKWYPKDSQENSFSNLLKGIIDHRVRNSLMVITGFEARLQTALKQQDYARALSYTEIISQAGERLSKDLALFREIKELLFSPDSKEEGSVQKFSEYLGMFRREEFQIDKKILQKELLLDSPEKLTSQLFDRIGSFMLGNRRDHDLAVTLLSSERESVVVKFTCSGFKESKTDLDENIFFIRWIAETLGGKIEVGDEYLILTLPKAEAGK